MPVHHDGPLMSAFLVKNGEYIKIGDSILNFNDIVYEKENKTMKKITRNDRIDGKTIKHCIKDGMQVVLRDGEVYLVETNINGSMYLTNNEGIIHLKAFNDDMTHASVFDKFDVIKIYHRSERLLSYPNLLHEAMNREILWERDEATPMTQEEIEKALGYKVKIKEE